MRVLKQVLARTGFAAFLLALLILAGRPALSLAAPTDKPADKSDKAAKVDLNTATDKELENLPGVGKATAKKIIDNRPYKSAADLKKAGLSEKKIEAIVPLVTFADAPAAEAPAAPAKTDPKADANTTPKPQAQPAKVDLNSATEKELEELPGVGPATAKKIVAGRPYKSVDELKKAGVSEREFTKIESLVAVRGEASAEKVEPKAAPKEASKTDSKVSTGEKSTAGHDAPAKGDVWVNTESGVYHAEGDRWYGKTKAGKYMTEDEAKKLGYRAAK